MGSIERSLERSKQVAADREKLKAQREAKEAATPAKTTAETLAEDIKTGQDVLGKDFEKGSFGRLEEGRSQDVKDIIAKRKAGLAGLSSEENQALRERGKQGIQRGTQTSLRALRGIQGASGVRGATAGAQQAGVLAAGQAAEANVERDLFIKNIDVKRQALGAFESSIGGAEAGEQARSEFNIGQTQREIFGKQAAGLGFAGLSVAERTGTKAAEAARAAGGGGGGKGGK